MTAPVSFIGRYSVLLKAWMERQDEAALEEAYRLGKEAVAKDMSMLDVVATHIELMRDVNFNGEKASKLLGELLVPFEEMLLQTLAGYELHRQGQKVLVQNQQVLVEQQHEVIAHKEIVIVEKEAKVQQAEERIKYGKLERQIRDGLMFAAGLAGAGYETIIGNSERPALIVLFAAMMGLPSFLKYLLPNGKEKSE